MSEADPLPLFRAGTLAASAGDHHAAAELFYDRYVALLDVLRSHADNHVRKLIEALSNTYQESLYLFKWFRSQDGFGPLEDKNTFVAAIMGDWQTGETLYTYFNRQCLIFELWLLAATNSTLEYAVHGTLRSRHFYMPLHTWTPDAFKESAYRIRNRCWGESRQSFTSEWSIYGISDTSHAMLATLTREKTRELKVVLGSRFINSGGATPLVHRTPEWEKSGWELLTNQSVLEEWTAAVLHLRGATRPYWQLAALSFLTAEVEKAQQWFSDDYAQRASSSTGTRGPFALDRPPIGDRNYELGTTWTSRKARVYGIEKVGRNFLH